MTDHLTHDSALVPDKIRVILDNLPTRPGVYLMKDASGRVIYVGKAINLRSRVRSYFQPANLSDPLSKPARMVPEIADIEIIVVDSELEALLTEINLIKSHKPHFNVLLKDDKHYPYIKVHWSNDFPRVTVTRRMVDDGSRYFGPYTGVAGVYQTLDVLRKAFPYLTCNREITGNDDRACLYYDIRLCNAPCIGAVSREEYREGIQALMDFLKGKSDNVLTDMEKHMWHAAERMDYERAARIRDQIQAMESVTQKQKVISTVTDNQDVIAFAQDREDAIVQVFLIRSGRIVGKEYFVMEGASNEASGEIITEFIKQFYDRAAEIPPEILLPHELQEAEVIESWLQSKRGKKVIIRVPQKGQKRQIVSLVENNATETLEMLRAQWGADTLRQETGLREIQEALGLAAPPSRMECFDISNTQGTAISASRVVFVNGVPKKKEYRKFNIQTVVGHPDDYASMKEALDRRFRRWQESREIEDALSEDRREEEATWALLPDHLIVDGGKGQLGVAVEVLEKYDLLDKVPVAGLAKQMEELFVPGKRQSIRLPARSQGLFLLQRIRDEAHRFAITHQRERRLKGVASQLDAIPGIGPKRRRELLTRFGSIDGIRKASRDDIASIPGIGPDLADVIKSELGQ